jgi:hypothetical protein
MFRGLRVLERRRARGAGWSQSARRVSEPSRPRVTFRAYAPRWSAPVARSAAADVIGILD